MSHQLVDRCLWFTENPSFHIIELVNVRHTGGEFLVMSALLELAKFLTESTQTVVVAPKIEKCTTGRWHLGWRSRLRTLHHDRSDRKSGSPIESDHTGFELRALTSTTLKGASFRSGYGDDLTHS